MSDETHAEDNARADTPAAHVRRWLDETKSGTLCTLSADARARGYPFGSIVPFARDLKGLPFVQIASIAAHTKNLVADPRASLLVQQPSLSADHDPQAGWRLTLVGTMARVDDSEHAALLERLIARVPRAREYDATHDFALWRLRVEHVRYIAGFGKICWLTATETFDPG